MPPPANFTNVASFRVSGPSALRFWSLDFDDIFPSVFETRTDCKLNKLSYE